MLYIGYLITLDGQGIKKKISFRELLLPSASPPREQSTPSRTHPKWGKNYINTR